MLDDVGPTDLRQREPVDEVLGQGHTVLGVPMALADVDRVLVVGERCHADLHGHGGFPTSRRRVVARSVKERTIVESLDQVN